ncbi:DUF1330 domain-containing protein [Thermaurantiacus sp.]
MARKAYLVVTANVTDPAAMKAYNEALARSGLYGRHGGRYLIVGRAAVDLEAWDGRAVVVAEFPDRAAAEAFWNDPLYQQEIKPLRAGAGTFHVAIFEAAA